MTYPVFGLLANSQACQFDYSNGILTKIAYIHLREEIKFKFIPMLCSEHQCAIQLL